MSSFFAPLFDFTGERPLAVPARLLVAGGRKPNNEIDIVPVETSLAIGPQARSGKLPLVSCLMVTKNRFRQAQLAIACYRRQTWPNRRLIILDQSADDRLGEWIGGLADPTIDFHQAHALPGALGALRNRSVELATGDFICQWDDDDLQHPARLELAMAAMAATKTAVSMLARELLWFPSLGRIGIARRRSHENTLLAARALMPPYPDLPRLEDTPVVGRLMNRHRVALLELPELYIYVAHGANTWDAAHMEEMWQSATGRADLAAESPLYRLLEHSFPLAEYTALVGAPPTAPLDPHVMPEPLPVSPASPAR